MKNIIRFIAFTFLLFSLISFENKETISFAEFKFEKELNTHNKQLFPKLSLDTVLYNYLDSISLFLLDCDDFIQDSFYVNVYTKYNNKMDYLIFDVDVSEGLIVYPNENFKVYGSLLINEVQFIFTYYSDSLIPPPKYIDSFAELQSDSLSVCYKYDYELDFDQRILYNMWPICEKCIEESRIIYSENARSVLYTEICFSSLSRLK